MTLFRCCSARLKRLVPHESLVVYLRKNDLLVAEFVSGENFRLFSSLKIPLGKGLSGWVAQNHKPILNGNPSVEPGYPNDAAQGITLRSALAVPSKEAPGLRPCWRFTARIRTLSAKKTSKFWKPSLPGWAAVWNKPFLQKPAWPTLAVTDLVCARQP